VWVLCAELRDFRSWETATLELGRRVTVISGPNGAGKTNLIEALYFGCTGRSCRTLSERELVRFGSPAARVEVTTSGPDGEHVLTAAVAPGQAKRMRVDGVDVQRLIDSAQRPLVSVFLPDRLQLVKGPPALRRAHLDQFVAALWPARAGARRAYAGALAQRNALLARVRAGTADRGALTTWDAQLARAGLELMRHRNAAAAELSGPFCAWCSRLGLDGDPQIEYRPRSAAASERELAEELRRRAEVDIERAFTGHGPHRDELRLERERRELRVYASQGQQRLALLALLLAERDVLASRHPAPPLMLLDDALSELDADRRTMLVSRLCESPGQAVITTTDAGGLTAGDHDGIVHLAVADGRIRQAVAS